MSPVVLIEQYYEVRCATCATTIARHVTSRAEAETIRRQHEKVDRMFRTSPKGDPTAFSEVMS